MCRSPTMEQRLLNSTASWTGLPNFFYKNKA
jgi:hypothetical protein